MNKNKAKRSNLILTALHSLVEYAKIVKFRKSQQHLVDRSTIQFYQCSKRQQKVTIEILTETNPTEKNEIMCAWTRKCCPHSSALQSLCGQSLENHIRQYFVKDTMWTCVSPHSVLSPCINWTSSMHTQKLHPTPIVFHKTPICVTHAHPPPSPPPPPTSQASPCVQYQGLTLQCQRKHKTLPQSKTVTYFNKMSDEASAQIS